MEDTNRSTDETIEMHPVNPAEELEGLEQAGNVSVEPEEIAEDATVVMLHPLVTDDHEDLGSTEELPILEAAETDPFSPRESIWETTVMSPAVLADDDNPEVDQKPSAHPHRLRNIALGMLLVVVLTLGGFAGWLMWDDSQNASCHVPAGVSLDGDDISGLTSDEVRSAVTDHILSGTAGCIELKVTDKKRFTLENPKLGSVDVDGTVQAVMATIEPDKFNRCLQRALDLVGLGGTPQTRALTTVCVLNGDKVRTAIQAIANKTDRTVQDAGYRFDQDKRKIETVKAKRGIKVNVDATTQAVLNASQSGQVELDAVVETTAPSVTTPGNAIFVDLQKCHLYFYVDGKVSKDYPCTPGMSGYGTPRGDWTLSYKDPSPSWYNPHSKWSKNMPEVIPPGESNPLGLRALAVSCGGGIYIHGTINYGQLGSPGSHGCVRLANENVVELYDLVEVGIPIFIY